MCFHAYFVSSGGMHDVHQPYCPCWPHDEEDGTEDQLLVQKWTVMHTRGPMMRYITAMPVAHMYIAVPCAIPIYAMREIPCYRKPLSSDLKCSNARPHWHTHTHASSGQTRTKNWRHTTTDLLSSSRRTNTHINACTITIKTSTSIAIYIDFLNE